MIKFFRKIRYDLMAENKSVKYLKYAIGEIVLVVIGILIALSINNWNQERISQNKAYSYLNQINKDLSLDIMYFDYLIKLSSETSLIFDNVVKNTSENDTHLEKLGSVLTNNWDQREYGPSYKSFVNSGDIDLIEDKELLFKLQDYYSFSTRALNNLTEYHKNLNIHNIEGKLIQTLVTKEDGTYSLESMKKEINSGNLKSIINYQNNFFKKLITLLDSNKKEAQELQVLIKGLEIAKG